MARRKRAETIRAEEKESRLAFLRGEIDRLQTFLSSTEPITSASGDGTSATFNRLEIIKEIDRYRLEIARLDGTKPRLTNIDF